MDLYQLIMPGAVGHEAAGIGFLEIGLTIGFTGLFMLVTFFGLSKAPLVPKNHPLRRKPSLSHKLLMKMKNLGKLILLAFVVLAFSSCNKDQNNPGYTFYPDMQYSQAYETYSTNPVFADGYTNRAPAEGTIPEELCLIPIKLNHLKIRC